MSRPVFLSMGGNADAVFAADIQKNLGDSIAYHYRKTGEENLSFRSEIEKEIIGCRIFVAFWSDEYLKSEHACLELAQFKKYAEASTEHSKYLMIVPRNAGTLDIQNCKWKNPINSIEEFTFGRWRLNRAVNINTDSDRVTELIKKKLGEMDVVTDVLITRGWLLDRFKLALTIPAEYKTREILFVTGLDGTGRRTALKQYMSSSFPHLVMKQINIDTIDLPEDFLHQTMATTTLSVQQRSDIFEKIKIDETTHIKEIRKILHTGRDLECYYVVSIDRYVGVDVDKIPQWFSELFKPFTTGPRPLIFIVTSSHVSHALLDHYPGAGTVEIPSLEDHQTEELVALLINKENNPTRWTKEKRKTVSTICGNNPSLCKSVMYALRIEPNLDFVENIAKKAEIKFSEGLSGLLSHWVERYSNKPTDLAMLRVIEKLGVTSKEALDEILEPVITKHGESNLYELKNQGLIEQLGDGLYRIPPLVQRRLGDTLWSKAIQIENIDLLLTNFARKASIPKTEFGPIYAKNIIQAAVKNNFSVSNEYESYISISALFKIGIDKYRNKIYFDADSIFTRIMNMMHANQKYIDIRLQLEIYRYSGMAACRHRNFRKVNDVCEQWRKNFSNSKRKQAAYAIAFFLEGYALRNEEKFDLAIKKYKDALRLIEHESQFHVQNSSLYSELAISTLKCKQPNYLEARDYALKAYKTSDVIQTLNTYIRALIFYAFKSGVFSTTESNFENIREINEKLNLLKGRCIESNLGHYDEQQKFFDTQFSIWQRLH